jgi:hypothetical protein
MLNRSKLVIDVEPFIFPQTFAFMSCSKAACGTEVAVKRPRQLSAANAGGTPRRTASFPNGDVRQPQTPIRIEVPANRLRCIDLEQRTGPQHLPAQKIRSYPTVATAKRTRDWISVRLPSESSCGGDAADGRAVRARAPATSSECHRPATVRRRTGRRRPRPVDADWSGRRCR